jgi:hypothetical protein
MTIFQDNCESRKVHNFQAYVVEVEKRAKETDCKRVLLKTNRNDDDVAFFIFPFAPILSVKSNNMFI